MWCGRAVTGSDTLPANNSASAAVAISDDGVDDSVEDGAPNGGDGNYDGIPDSLQPGVTSILLGGEYVTMEVSGACARAENVAELGDGSLPADPGGIGVRIPVAAPVPPASPREIPVMGLPALGLLIGLVALLGIRRELSP